MYSLFSIQLQLTANALAPPATPPAQIANANARNVMNVSKI